MLTKKLSFFLIMLILSFPCYAKNGIYIILDGGVAKQTGLPEANAIGALSRESQTFPAAHASIGYNHDLFKCFGIGLDVGTGRYGKETYIFPLNEHSSIRSRTLEFSALLQYHLMEQWDILTRIGGARQTILFSGTHQLKDQTQINPELSVSIAYNLNPCFAILLSYVHIIGDDQKNFKHINNKTSGINAALIGVRYTFNSSP